MLRVHLVSWKCKFICLIIFGKFLDNISSNNFVVISAPFSLRFFHIVCQFPNDAVVHTCFQSFFVFFRLNLFYWSTFQVHWLFLLYHSVLSSSSKVFTFLDTRSYFLYSSNSGITKLPWDLGTPFKLQIQGIFFTFGHVYIQIVLWSFSPSL